jgi:hypothetical protein
MAEKQQWTAQIILPDGARIPIVKVILIVNSSSICSMHGIAMKRQNAETWIDSLNFIF